MVSTLAKRRGIAFIARVAFLAGACFLAQCALAANVFLTNAQFTNRGVGEFIGTITDVQVLTSDQYSESGTVQLQVTRVIAGTLAAQTVTFPYQRTLSPIDDASNWDLLAPTYVSLEKIGSGRSVLVHFVVSNGTYSLAPAGNAVQDVSQGILLGKIKKGRPSEARSSDRDHTVEVEVVEVVYGWVDGTQISFPGFHESQKHTAHVPDFLTLDGAKQISNNDHDRDENLVFIEFDAKGITGIEVATSELLTELQQADAE